MLNIMCLRCHQKVREMQYKQPVSGAVWITDWENSHGAQ